MSTSNEQIKNNVVINKTKLTPKAAKLYKKNPAKPNQKCSNLVLQQKHQNVTTTLRHRLCQIPHKKTNVD